MLNDLAKSLFGSSGSASGVGVTMLYGIAVEDSENGEVLIKIDDEIIAANYEDETEEMLEIEIEADDDSVDTIEDDAQEEEIGEFDDPEDFDDEADEINDDDETEDSTDEPDESEGV